MGESLRERVRDPDTGTETKGQQDSLKEVRQRPRKRGTETQNGVKEMGETETHGGNKEKEKGQKEEKQGEEGRDRGGGKDSGRERTETQMNGQRSRERENKAWGGGWGV